MDKRIQEVIESMDCNFRQFAHKRAQGMDDAYQVILQAAFDGSSAAHLADMAKTLENTAMDDTDTDYEICYGRREFYHIAAMIFETLAGEGGK